MWLPLGRRSALGVLVAGAAVLVAGKLVTSADDTCRDPRDGLQVKVRRGVKVAEWQCANGERHGPARMYFPGGTIEREGAFTHGQMSGRWTYYDADGGVLRTSGGEE